MTHLSVQRIGRLAGTGFLAMGLIQVAVVLLPMQLGVPEWELAAFGELSGTFGSAAIGLTILAWFAISGRSNGLLAAAMGGSIFFTVVALLGLAVVALDLPLVLQATATGEPGAADFRVAVAKMMLLLALYLVFFFLQTYLLVSARKRQG